MTLPGDVLDPALGEVEGRASRARVDSLVVNLRGGEGVPVPVACDLARAPHVVVADGLPPDDGHPIAHVAHLAVCEQ